MSLRLLRMAVAPLLVLLITPAIAGERILFQEFGHDGAMADFEIAPARSLAISNRTVIVSSRTYQEVSTWLSEHSGRQSSRSSNFLVTSYSNSDLSATMHLTSSEMAALIETVLAACTREAVPTPPLVNEIAASLALDN